MLPVLLMFLSSTGKVTAASFILADSSFESSGCIELHGCMQRFVGVVCSTIAHLTSHHLALHTLAQSPATCLCCLQIQYVTVPMSNERSGYSLKPNMYAFNEDQVATDFYDNRCSSSSKTQPATPAAAAAHRRRALLRQQHSQWLQLAAAQSSSAAGNSSTHAAGHSVQPPPGEQLQQQHNWQRVAQPVLGAARQLAAAASQHWQQLQQHMAAAGSQLQSAARHMRLLQPPVTQQQPRADIRDAFDVSSSGSSQQRQSRQLMDAAAAAAAAQGSASLRGVALQRLALQQIGTPPEWQCESLQVGQSEMPIPALKVELFGHMAGVLQQSYEVFREVRERLKL